MNLPKVLFLYTELAAYTVACMNRAVDASSELHVVRWPVNKEAPFQFNIDPRIKLYDREKFTSEQLLEKVKSIDPDILVISGWIDKGYMRIGREMSKRIPSVLTLDNPWKGDLKQQLAATVGRWPLHKAYTHCWVPGERQFKYARKLGFAKESIRKGFYSADVDHFNELYQRTFEAKRADFPKRFLYVGRYVDFKGIEELWRAFTAFRQSEGESWELWCVGTGEAYDQRIQAEGIRHFGFLQPEEMEKVIAQAGVFILPSRKEPWGVVVQEFAAAGFPLICSDEVGSAEMFLLPGENGFVHRAGDEKSIAEMMHEIARLSPNQLVEMGERSHQLAQLVNPDTWTRQLMSFLSK